ncbi:uncharacterized protein [Medicago truncatula]|uniref:Polynucleotidyl transferase, Ribonuclease H fold n=1 Tax=Medicago truncatula TaxID=3880 RepID=A2Q5T2_MEDTR|nr:uncharacterized protein LOC120576840 [Medicago truncatula]ABN08952.1 Polynucleotidyl transferase, Ribonuclease H fold [Medicago truncatula]
MPFCGTGLAQEINAAVLTANSAADVVFQLLRMLLVELKQQLATVFWSLWKRRNLLIWENKNESCAMVVDRARVLLERRLAFCQHNRKLKCNIDASFSISQNRTGIGLCRDGEGNFVLAKTMNFAVVHAADVREALGLYHALEWLWDMQLDNIDFEVDSRTTQLAFYARKDDVSEFGNVITACRGILSTKFTNSRVEFIQRQADEVAHVFVGEATLVVSPTIYYHVPLCIDNLIFNDKL